MLRSFRLAGLALLAALSPAAAQRSTITRDAFRPRADSLVFTSLPESHPPRPPPPPPPPPRGPPTPPAPSRPPADSLVFTYLAESHAPSAAFAVIRGSDTLAFGAHGLANVEAWRAPTAATIYEIGSITKQFTSAAIMKLVEQGRVKLDDDLSKYVPQFPLQGRKVSIRQLLSHTSGIHSYTSSPGW